MSVCSLAPRLLYMTALLYALHSHFTPSRPRRRPLSPAGLSEAAGSEGSVGLAFLFLARSLCDALLPAMTIYTSPYTPIAADEYHKGGVYDFIFAPERLENRRDQVAIIDAVTGAKVRRHR